MTRIRMGLVPGLLLAVGVAVAACGGGGGGKGGGVASLGGADQPTTTNAAGSNAGGEAGYDLRQALVFTRCMRQHGYDMPDPQMEGNTVGLQLPNYEGQRAPKFQAAWQACRRYAPNGGRPQRPSAEDRQQALAFARCMRQHGINLPDPQVTAEGIDQPPAPVCAGTTRGPWRRSRPAPKAVRVASERVGDAHGRRRSRAAA